MENRTEVRRVAEPVSVTTKALLGLLVLVPISILLAVVHANPPLVFAVSALALIPLAGFLGRATEEVALYTGPRLGGLLNATFGNAAELIITIVALRAGLTTTVKATLAGSILGNVLFVLGASILLGGLKFGTQTFDRTDASAACTMLALAVISLLLPSFFHHGAEPLTTSRLEGLSFAVAIILFVIYVLYLIFSFRRGPGGAGESLEEDTPNWSRAFALVVLFGSTLAVVVMSELLVHAIEPTVAAWGVSEFFVGIIIIPIVGNIAEHIVAVQVAMENKMDLSLSISLGSSLQIALFVAPVLVFVGAVMGQRLTLEFDVYELFALGGAAVIAVLVTVDGESHWLEGAQLLALYLMLAVAFFFL
ncbi:MAG: calcium/proton exchanger [Chloroflexota bacterium]|nr:calcium/proton exchanger [Chloroflexota bacterium]